jgi:hypothetical protein
LAPWLSIVVHPVAAAGAIVASSWIFRHCGKTILQLVAGLVVIFSSDKRSRADRALDVLRTISTAEEVELPEMRDEHHGTSERPPIDNNPQPLTTIIC